MKTIIYYLISFIITIIFVIFFTEEKNIYDVSYSYSDSENVAYSQVSISSVGKPSYAELSKFIENNAVEDEIQVTIISLSKRKTERYFKPFWRK